jgi:hypothetical protein
VEGMMTSMMPTPESAAGSLLRSESFI